MTVGRIIDNIAEIFFPYIPKCVGCGVEKGVESYVCEKCAAELNALKAGEVCGCGVDAYALYRYDGMIPRIVKAYKYSGNKWLARFMGDEMAKAAVRDFSGIDCICHVPLHEKRRRMRGFDQAQVLAGRISKAASIPYVDALKRVKNTKAQASLGANERRQNMIGAFEKKADVHGSVLLIDDVLTTGATTVECAAVLKNAGAKNVYVLTFAKSAYDGVEIRDNS